MKYYQPINLYELLEITRGNILPDKNCFHLTFDDGLSEFYHIVAPILKEKGISATVFLNTDFIDNKSMFYRFKASILFDHLKDKSILSKGFDDRNELDEMALNNGINFNTYLEEEKPYLTTSQIKELIEDGFTFGAHSKNHPSYKHLTLEEQLNQTKESISIVVDQFNLNYKVFSFPFTDDGVSHQFFETIKNETDITFGCAGLKKETYPFHLQRIVMETNKTAKQILKPAYFYYLITSMVSRNKIKY